MTIFPLFAFVLCLVPLSLVVYNRVTWVKRRFHSDRALELSVLIPARNEEHNIGALLQNLLTLKRPEWVREVVVCDDSSSDNTASIVAQHSVRDPRIRLINAGPIPSGWIGKPYACERLFLESTGRHLLFVDADVRLERDALSQLAGMLDQAGGGLVTAVPHQVTGTFFERLILPLLHLTYLSWLPLNWANHRHDPKTVAACGQILLTERSTLESLGGFVPVRHSLVDDVALARHARSKGVFALFYDGALVARCRMYRSSREVWSGFAKNLYLGLGSPLALLIAWVLYGGAFILPFVLLAFVCFSPSSQDGLELLLIAGAVLANAVVRLVLLRAYSQSLLSALLHPFAVLVLLFLSGYSAWKVALGRVQWAGRSYDPKVVTPLSSGGNS